jgi:uncharacterized protein YbcI
MFRSSDALREMPDADSQGPPKQSGAVLTQISDGMVSLLKEYYGVGPTQAKTYYHDDLVVCVLRGGFTRVEKTLAAGGRGDAAIEQRMAFQEVMRERFEAVVQAATGRPVIGFMSGNQQDPAHDLRSVRAESHRPRRRARDPRRRRGSRGDTRQVTSINTVFAPQSE